MHLRERVHSELEPRTLLYATRFEVVVGSGERNQLGSCRNNKQERTKGSGPGLGENLGEEQAMHASHSIWCEGGGRGGQRISIRDLSLIPSRANKKKKDPQNKDANCRTISKANNLRNESAGKREIPEKPRRQAASHGTIPTCKHPGVTPLIIEPGSHRWEASSLTTTPPKYLFYFQDIPPPQANKAKPSLEDFTRGTTRRIHAQSERRSRTYLGTGVRSCQLSGLHGRVASTPQPPRLRWQQRHRGPTDPPARLMTSGGRSNQRKGNLRLRVSSSEECGWQAGLHDRRARTPVDAMFTSAWVARSGSPMTAQVVVNSTYRHTRHEYGGGIFSCRQLNEQRARRPSDHLGSTLFVHVLDVIHCDRITSCRPFMGLKSAHFTVNSLYPDFFFRLITGRELLHSRFERQPLFRSGCKGGRCHRSSCKRRPYRPSSPAREED
ncbi:hypothetical protein PR048_004094 [Dryococelus australis]|uniref:Uncharacterized protein n=1 Tax=Dryococelus australis TaxID=614101 RepID=A0ABQ9I4I0_9NEOP|nr:hypothetical protein PR048_004094 [Dryococelus australis]